MIGNIKVCDLHCDTISVIKHAYKRFNKEFHLNENELSIDINKMEKGNYLLQTFAMFIYLRKEIDPYIEVKDMIQVFKKEINSNNDKIKQVYSYDDIIENERNGLMSALLSVEEGAVVKGDLSLLEDIYNDGVRMITLTWNFENEIGYPHVMGKVNSNLGLKPFGLAMIKKMEELGIIIDVSHLSDDGFYDVYNNTTKPFIASHSNSRSVCNHSRNLTDDMILKLASRGGVMGINYCDSFINEGSSKEELFVNVDDLVKHIEYIKNLAGVDCIALGSDFDGIGLNNEIDNASKMQLLKDRLYERGFTKEEIEKIFYKNVLRVFKACLK